MPDVHVYVNKPPGKETSGLEDLEDAVKKLDYVSEVSVDPEGSVVAVSFEGDLEEREGIEHAIEEAGYEVQRLSVRTTFPNE